MYLTESKIYKLLLPIANKYKIYLDGGGPRYQFHSTFCKDSEMNKIVDFTEEIKNLFNGDKLPILKIEIKNVPGPSGGMISIKLPRPSKPIKKIKNERLDMASKRIKLC